MGKDATKKTVHDTKCQVTECEVCKLRRPFELPTEIVESCNGGRLIIFAGAGVSTESMGIFPQSFYYEIRDELSIPKKQNVSFSKLMSLYCSPPRSRKDLLLKIKERIDYVHAFPELYGRVTEFHSELSTIPHIHEIFTTNWDDFFEKECGAIPVVTGEDYAIFEDIPGRKVFKIHGSVYNYGSIVATEQDYKECYKKLSTGIIGAKLKTFLLSRTMVFVGFSFEDEDFQRIYRLLKKDVKGMIPHLYVVTLDENADKKLQSLKINAKPIITNAVSFIQNLKKQLTENNQMLPDRNFRYINEIHRKVWVEHGKVSSLGILKHPDSIYSLCYQDGLQHAFEHIISNKHAGRYSDPGKMVRVIESYDYLVKQYLHVGNYVDCAYFTGYLNGQMYLLLDDKERKSLPLYYLFGCDSIFNFKQFLKLEKNAAKYHKSAHKFALKMAKRIHSDGIVFHRTPFL